MPGQIGHCCLIWSICVLRQWDVAEVQVCMRTEFSPFHAYVFFFKYFTKFPYLICQRTAPSTFTSPDSLIAFILKDPALPVSCFLSHKHGLADQSVLLR